jgi:hypothetical protein
MIDPLFNAGWIRFNEDKWEMRAERVILEPEKRASWRLETVLYWDRYRSLCHPARNPHLPLNFQITGQKLSAHNRRMRAAMERLAEFVCQHRIRGGGLTFSPLATDMRAFQWRGLDMAPRFTYHLDLPCCQEHIDPSALKKMRKARDMGYVCEVTVDFQAVQECLLAPERRKGFEHQVTASELGELYRLVGPSAMMAILCKNKAGEPKGARVVIYAEGGLALGWSAGVKTDALKDGVNNLLVAHTLKLLVGKDCKVFDFVGANIPSVAEMKEAWGGRLVTYYQVRPRNLRNLARNMLVTAQQIFHGPQL